MAEPVAVGLIPERHGMAPGMGGCAGFATPLPPGAPGRTYMGKVGTPDGSINGHPQYIVVFLTIKLNKIKNN